MYLKLSCNFLGVDSAAAGDRAALDLYPAPFVLKVENFARGEDWRLTAEETVGDVGVEGGVELDESRRRLTHSIRAHSNTFAGTSATSLGEVVGKEEICI